MKRKSLHNATICQWPLTEERPWRFCDRPLPDDRRPLPYCDEHHAVALPRRVEPRGAEEHAG
jgi:hypothetical protein